MERRRDNARFCGRGGVSTAVSRYLAELGGARSASGGALALGDLHGSTVQCTDNSVVPSLSRCSLLVLCDDKVEDGETGTHIVTSPCVSPSPFVPCPVQPPPKDAVSHIRRSTGAPPYTVLRDKSLQRMPFLISDVLRALLWPYQRTYPASSLP